MGHGFMKMSSAWYDNRILKLSASTSSTLVALASSTHPLLPGNMAEDFQSSLRGQFFVIGPIFGGC